MNATRGNRLSATLSDLFLLAMMLTMAAILTMAMGCNIPAVRSRARCA